MPPKIFVQPVRSVPAGVQVTLHYPGVTSDKLTSHEIQVELNGQTLHPATFRYTDHRTGIPGHAPSLLLWGALPDHLLRRGTNTLVTSVPGPNGERARAVHEFNFLTSKEGPQAG